MSASKFSSMQSDYRAVSDARLRGARRFWCEGCGRWQRWYGFRPPQRAAPLCDRCSTMGQTVRTANKRAARLGAPGIVDAAGLLARHSLYGGRCWICEAPAAYFDHVIPLAVGGPNVHANMRPICASCNNRKASTHPVDVFALRVAARVQREARAGGKAPGMAAVLSRRAYLAALAR